jgi:outer membrane protein OmpA-like peptidoglycan-associated protein
MRTYQDRTRGRAGALSLLGGLVFLVSCALPAVAQQRRYLVELSGAGAYQSFDDATQLGGGTGGVGRLGIWLPANFSLEAEGSILSSKVDNITQTGVTVKTFGISALYNIPIGAASSFYLKAGGGGTRYGGDCPATSTALDPPCGSSAALLLGAGARAAVSPTVMIRGEGLLTRNSSTSVNFSNFGFNLGLSVMLGSKPIEDSDGDGVLNNRDRCSDTPSGAQVDGRGCPADGDNDGVPDGVDRCPTTPAGAAVDTAGCTRDSDSDNIADGLDRCPDTQSGVLVDPRGCPRDSDNDAIPDGLDRCSETPRGATVDALGCPGDEDGDGVLDGLDRCPRTVSGARVNAVGCATGQNPNRAAPAAPPPSAARPQPTPRDTAAAQAPSRAPTPAPSAAQRAPAKFAPGILRGVEFAPGTARLTSGSYVALDSLAQVLLADAELRIEVAAHTDNQGTATANFHLTNLQAEAVKNYLVTKGVPFQQVVARGYGATVPLTPDTTPRGRAANRRIEVKAAVPGL